MFYVTGMTVYFHVCVCACLCMCNNICVHKLVCAGMRMCVCVNAHMCVHECVHTMCMFGVSGGQKRYWILDVTEESDSCEQPCGCWELQVLLTVEPSL
jgi:hypothetical protein